MSIVRVVYRSALFMDLAQLAASSDTSTSGFALFNTVSTVSSDTAMLTTVCIQSDFTAERVVHMNRVTDLQL